MSGEVEQALLDAARLGPEDDVLVLGGGDGLVFGARERVGDGWIYAVRAQVDELEQLLGEAHASNASGVAYLVGEPAVLPLPDGAVSAAVGRLDGKDVAAAAAELSRVVSTGGRVAFAADVEDALRSAGFEVTDVLEVAGETVVAARHG